MAESQDYNKEIIKAIEEKENWFNVVQLPKIQDAYRFHLTCVRNLFDAMVKRSLVTPDPYKNDKKITDIECPESTDFTENERSFIFGTRLSDYESTLDFICNYICFTVEQLTPEKIRKLLEFNSCFGWTSSSSNSSKPNSRALLSALDSLRKGAPQLTLSLIQDSTVKSENALRQINEILRSLLDFQKERYKGDIRKYILLSSDFDKEKAYSSGNALFTEIKKNFKLIPNRSFTPEYVNELIGEEISSDAPERREKLLKKMKVENEKSAKKEVKIDTKEMLVEVVRVMGTLNDQYLVIMDRISSNHKILQDEKNSLGRRIARFFRKIFGIAEPEVEYDLILQDKKTDNKKHEKIQFNQFMAALSKRIRSYASFSEKNSPGYQRIFSQEETAILDFLNRQVTENNHLFAQFTAFDAYFKQHVLAEDRSKIHGLLMELTTVKNILVKVRQLRAEYLAYIEEQEQMKKLGISE